MKNKPLKRVAVTGGAGQIAYNLLFRLGSGECFGQDQPIALHILEIPEALKALEGIKMELEDCAYPLLKEVHIGSDPNKIFGDVQVAILVGAKPRGPGMERKELLNENSKIFVAQGKALNEVADRRANVFVIGNPCNTNCWITLQNAPNLNRKNFHAMTRLDQNRATFQLAKKAGVSIDEVKNVIIWGNHSATQVPDFLHAAINGKPVIEKIQSEDWLKGEFISTVQKRGAAIIAARGKSSAASAANAIIDSVKAIHDINSTSWFSSGVISDGNQYGIAENLIFSFPCRIRQTGDYEIVNDLKIDPYMQNLLKITEKELLEEQEILKAS